jgi:hypothetical protein
MSENEENDPQPILSEATTEQLFQEIYRRVHSALLVQVKDAGSTVEERTYFYGGSGHLLIGATQIVLDEIAEGLRSTVEEDEDEEEAEA